MKYLFRVEYKDGEVFNQNPKDMSKQDPKRSAYFDIDQGRIKTFSLIGDHSFLVDLEDGHFEVNGVSFSMHDEPFSDFRLIFFRRHRHNFNLKYQELSHEITYRMGWQCTKDGKNHQRIMEIE